MSAFTTAVADGFPVFGQALLNAFILLATSCVLSTILGALLCAIDICAHRSVGILVRIYSWLAQTTPPLILLFLAFYGSTMMGHAISPMMAAIIAFVFFATSYYFEIFRASYEGVPRGQFEAARALGIPPWPFATGVVVPQIIRIAAGPFVGRTTVLFKETSLASAISVSEIMGTASAYIYSGASPLLMVAIAGGIYAVINIALIALEKHLTRKAAA